MHLGGHKGRPGARRDPRAGDSRPAYPRRDSRWHRYWERGILPARGRVERAMHLGGHKDRPGARRDLRAGDSRPAYPRRDSRWHRYWERGHPARTGLGGAGHAPWGPQGPPRRLDLLPPVVPAQAETHGRGTRVPRTPDVTAAVIVTGSAGILPSRGRVERAMHLGGHKGRPDARRDPRAGDSRPAYPRRDSRWHRYWERGHPARTRPGGTGHAPWGPQGPSRRTSRPTGGGLASRVPPT